VSARSGASLSEIGNPGKHRYLMLTGAIAIVVRAVDCRRVGTADLLQ
jgi:hypothetical protein